MADCLNNQPVPGQVKMFDPNLFSSPPQQASNEYNNFNLSGAAAANGFDPNAWTNSSPLDQQWNWGGNLSNNSVQENTVSGEQSYPSQNYGYNDNSSVELAESETPKQQWEAQSAADCQSAQQWQNHTEEGAAGTQQATTHPNVNIPAQNVVATSSSIILHLRKINLHGPQYCQETFTTTPSPPINTGLNSQQQFPPASGLFNTTNPSLVTGVNESGKQDRESVHHTFTPTDSPDKQLVSIEPQNVPEHTSHGFMPVNASSTAETKSAFSPVSASIEIADEQNHENPVLTGMNPASGGITTVATIPIGDLTNPHHTQSDTSAAFDHITDRGFTSYKPHSAGVLSTEHHQHSLSNPAVVSQQHLRHPNDESQSQQHPPGHNNNTHREHIRSCYNETDQDDIHRRDESRNCYYRGIHRSQDYDRDDRDRPDQSRNHYPRPQSRQDLYTASHGDNDYYSSDDLYRHGKKEKIRAYKQYQYDSSQQKQRNYAVPAGYYDQHGNYYARSQSYDSNYSYYRNSHHSQSRDSIHTFPRDLCEILLKGMSKYRFAKELNNSQSSNRQTGYEQSPIYSVNLGQRQVQPALPEPESATPSKYTLPHVEASFMPGGKLIEVQPNRPQDAQQAISAKEMKAFPGPLSRNETLKSDVLSFCQDKVKELSSVVGMIDIESACLLWRYLELLVKQNGIVLGIDIANLLMEDHAKSAQNMPIIGSNAPMDTSIVSAANNTDLHCSVTAERSMVSPASGAALDRFRYLCLFGRKKEALEFAMKSNLWEQALFLAMAMGPMISASVTTRFMNSTLKLNDPLSTFYQMLSGRQPAACTMVGDEQFGDWRPHLAVILSQATEITEIDTQNIIAMGDAFATKGRVSESHFCYIMANCKFKDPSEKTAKLVLLGSNHMLPLQEHATNLSIIMTEILEYGRSLANPNFCIQSLMEYKLLYTSRLVDAGLEEKALQYCKILSGTILQSAASYPKSLVQGVAELAERLKKFGPTLQQSEEELPDPTWLQKMQALSRQNESDALPFVSTSGRETPAAANTPSISDVGEQMQNPITGQDDKVIGCNNAIHHNPQQDELDQVQQIPMLDQNTQNMRKGKGQQRAYHWVNNMWVQKKKGSIMKNWLPPIPELPQEQYQQTNQQDQLHLATKIIDIEDPATPLGIKDLSRPLVLTESTPDIEGPASPLGIDDHASPLAAPTDTKDKPKNKAYWPEEEDENKAKIMAAVSSQKITDIEDPATPLGNKDLSRPLVLSDSTPDIEGPASPLGIVDFASPLAAPTDTKDKPKKKAYWPEEEDENKAKIMAAVSSQKITDIEDPATPLGNKDLSRPLVLSDSTPDIEGPASPLGNKDLSRPLVLSESTLDIVGPASPLGIVDFASLLAAPTDTKDKPKKKAYWPGEEDEDKVKIMAAVSSQKKKERRGLFGWLFGKSKPSNEMKLPDDKKPTIIWDTQKNKWVNTEKVEEEKVENSAPPPKDADLSTAIMGINRGGSQGPPPPNRYSRGLSRGGRKPQYVDILARSSKTADVAPLINHMTKLQSVPSYHIFTPSGANTHSDQEDNMYNQYQQSPANQLMYQPQSSSGYGTPPAVVGHQSEWQQPPVNADAPTPPQPMQFFNPSNFQQPILL